MAEETVTEVNLSGGEDDGESLDNFFKKKSKKGKKKKKTKPDKGIILTEERGFEIDKPKKTEVEKDVEEKKEEDEESTTVKDQEEWLEFDDASNRDYSDLKIQNLQMEENQNDNQVVEQPPEYDDAGELIPPKAEEGPWKVKASTPGNEQVTPEPQVKAEPVKRTGAYVPPRVRAEQGKGTSLRRGRAQKAPEISNENDFPSLSAAAQDTEEDFRKFFGVFWR